MTTFGQNRFWKITIAVLTVGCFAGLFLVSQTRVVAQENATPAAEASASAEQLKADFDGSIEELRTAIKKIKRSGMLYFNNSSREQFEIREQWEVDAIAAEAAYQKVKRTAFAYFLAAKNPSKDAKQIVRKLTFEQVDHGELTLTYAAAHKLLDFYPNDEHLMKLMGHVAILTNDFDFAQKYAATNKSVIEDFPMIANALYSYLDEMSEKWKRELKIRAEETAADDLPHAIIETTKGTIVIELFENQAPETVANFVSLVQTGYYDRMIFHHVLENVLAHTGKMSMNRSLPIGYTIYDEMGRPDARHHFRGSVAMFLNTDEPNVGGAEFQILQIPRPNLDGRITVFGRVISDMRIVDVIQPTVTITDEGKEKFIEGAVPDTIKSITVKRLRNHEYEPNRVKKD